MLVSATKYITLTTNYSDDHLDRSVGGGKIVENSFFIDIFGDNFIAVYQIDTQKGAVLSELFQDFFGRTAGSHHVKGVRVHIICKIPGKLVKSPLFTVTAPAFHVLHHSLFVWYVQITIKLGGYHTLSESILVDIHNFGYLEVFYFSLQVLDNQIAGCFGIDRVYTRVDFTPAGNAQNRKPLLTQSVENIAGCAIATGKENQIHLGLYHVLGGLNGVLGRRFPGVYAADNFGLEPSLKRLLLAHRCRIGDDLNVIFEVVFNLL